MIEVHRYKVVKMLSEVGNRINYAPHGPDVVIASDYDALLAERDQLKAENEQLRKGASCVDDLSALVRQLAQRLRKAAPDNDLPEKALDYLKRKGLQGSPLRTNQEDAPECAAQEIYKSWSGQEGFVPWVPGGNSLKQGEARRLARNAISDDKKTGD